MGDAQGTTLSFHEDGKSGRIGPRPEPVLVLALECGRPRAGSVRYRLSDLSAVSLGPRPRAPRRARRHRADDPRARQVDVVAPRPDRAELRPLGAGRHRVQERLDRRRPHHQARGADRRLADRARPHAVPVLRAAADRGRGAAAARAGADRRPTRVRDADAGVEPGADPAAPDRVVGDPDADRGRERHRQGGDRARDPRSVAAAAARSCRSTAARCPRTSSRASCSATRRARSAARRPTTPAWSRSADAGTLFLDEIGDLPASSQAALLRVLQEREVMPVGGTRPVEIDLRVVAATHRDLDDMVAEGSFRHDLFARLAGFRVAVPPLAERRTDLGVLIGAAPRADLPGRAPRVRHRRRPPAAALPVAAQRPRARAGARDRAGARRRRAGARRAPARLGPHRAAARRAAPGRAQRERPEGPRSGRRGAARAPGQRVGGRARARQGSQADPALDQAVRSRPRRIARRRTGYAVASSRDRARRRSGCAPRAASVRCAPGSNSSRARPRALASGSATRAPLGLQPIVHSRGRQPALGPRRPARRQPAIRRYAPSAPGSRRAAGSRGRPAERAMPRRERRTATAQPERARARQQQRGDRLGDPAERRADGRRRARSGSAPSRARTARPRAGPSRTSRACSRRARRTIAGAAPRGCRTARRTGSSRSRSRP